MPAPTTFTEAPTFSVPIDSIHIPEERQRKKAKANEALISSIRAFGLFSPIIIRSGCILVAGERRLDAHRQLGLAEINARNIEDLSERNAYLIELQENLAREQLTWQEETEAVAKYHAMRIDEFAGWTQHGTAEELGYSDASISTRLAVAAKLDDPAVSGCQTLKAAHTYILAKAHRSVAAARAQGAEFTEAVASMFEPKPVKTKEQLTAEILSIASGETPLETPQADTTASLLEAGERAAAYLKQKKAEAPAENLPTGPIICADFLEWAATYTGIPFDVIHCDFPYGKNYSGANTSKQAESSQPVYDDSKSVFDKLLAGFLSLYPKFTAPQAHCLFWHERKYEQEIIDAFVAAGWEHKSYYPIIWTKGNSGSPGDLASFRHCYEQAHLFSLGKRPLVKMVQDHFPAPVDEKKLHLSQKPVPMLKHFLSGLCDEHSRVLDPTCGSGSAVAAANLLGVDYAVGVEMDQANADIARFFVERRTTEGN